MTILHVPSVAGQEEGEGSLLAWAECTGRRPAAEPGRGGPRFVFYGRVSTEDYQDPVTSRARQRDQAGALVAGHGQIVAEFFDIGQSRTLAWARRPQAGALVAELADPDRGWDAVVIGEYERAFYGSQFASMAPLFAHYEIQLWTGRRPGRLRRRGSRADDNGARFAVQAGDHPHQDPGPHRDGRADKRTGPVPSRPGRPTGTGSPTPALIPTEPMRRGDGGRTGWSPTRKRRRRWRGSSRSG